MKYLILISVLCFAGCKSSPVNDYSKYTVTSAINLAEQPLLVQLDGEKPVNFHGDYDFNNGIQTGSIMYAGDAGLVGLFAQVLVHASVSAQMQDKKLSAQQQQADKVLDPLSAILMDFTGQALSYDDPQMTFSDVQTITTTDQTVLISLPTFFLAQDARHISLKHMVSVSQGQSKKVLYQNLIEVISPQIIADKPLALLSENDGALLKEMSQALYQQSLTLALADLSGQYADINTKQQSFKLLGGTAPRFERGVGIYEDDNKLVIRNLRGWLIAYHKPTSEQ